MAAPLGAAALLQLIWLASPALPVGGFSYSEGLEAAIESGRVTDEAGVAGWLLDQLSLGLARNELAVVAKAIPAWRRGDAASVEALNRWVLQTRESSELRQQTEQMGRSLAAWLANQTVLSAAGRIGAVATPAVAASPDVIPTRTTAPRSAIDATLATPRPHARADDVRAAAAVARLAALQPSPSWPIAFALAAARSGAPVREALLAHAFGWAENMVQAAVKAIPLGQSAGQRVLAALVEAMPAAVDGASTCDADARQAFTPMLAILSAQHETQYSRLFRS